MYSGQVQIRIPFSRLFSTSKKVSAFKDRFVDKKDLNKRPSDLEIKKKGLPQNTPTLGERIRRQEGGQFLVPDRKGGYYKGPTGTLRDYIDPELTAKQMVSNGFKDLKTEIIKWKSELGREDADKLPKLGEYRTEWSFDTEESRNKFLKSDSGISVCGSIESLGKHPGNFS